MSHRMDVLESVERLMDVVGEDTRLQTEWRLVYLLMTSEYVAVRQTEERTLSMTLRKSLNFSTVQIGLNN